MRRFARVSVMITLAITLAAQGADFGGFAPQQTYPVGDNPREVRAADFNGDGKLDLAVCNAHSTPEVSDICVLMGNGDGTFGAAVFYTVGYTPLSITAADLDGDGDVDLTVANGNGSPDPSVSILLNNGDGTFVTHQTYAFDIEVWGSVIMVHTMADFDADGDMDIALVMLTPNDVVFMPNDGSGTFGPPQLIDVVPAPGFPTDLEPGDFNGDGRPDLITVHGSAVARVLLNNGDATSWSALEFAAAADGVLSPPADFNGDGAIDLALTRTINPGGYLLVALGNGDGTFGPQTTYNVNRPYPPTTCDLNKDGHVDLIVPNFNPYNTASVMLGNGDGTFAAPQPFSVGGNNPQDPIAADVDDDSWLDIVTANRGGDNVSVLINLTEYPPGLGDLNCDGTVDFGDINPFVQFLSDFAGWQTMYPDCPATNGDINGDGTYPSFGDINPFVALVTGIP